MAPTLVAIVAFRLTLDDAANVVMAAGLVVVVVWRGMVVYNSWMPHIAPCHGGVEARVGDAADV
jgi:hypothetical protein